MKNSVSMVDITPKPVIFREAAASGSIYLRSETVNLIAKGEIQKGNPIETAKIAGTLAAKSTGQILPLCHPLPLTHVAVDVKVKGDCEVHITSTVRAEAKTGVEMEALTATAVALLTVWDMVKQYEKDEQGQYPETRISDIHVEKKVKKSRA